MNRGRIDQVSKMVDYEPDNFDTFFSDQEELAEKSKCEALTNALDNEINRVKQNIIKSKLDTGEYWLSSSGLIKFSDMDNGHLARLPRHLYNNHPDVNSSKDLPAGMINEIAKRGFKLLNNCIVIQ